jgi:hypothetical protein
MWLLALILMPLVSGCAEMPVSQTALCDGTQETRQAHAVALLQDAGPQSLVTGDFLLEQLAVGCEGLSGITKGQSR